MFFNHLIDAAKQKAASIKWEIAATRFDVRSRFVVRTYSYSYSYSYSYVVFCLCHMMMP